MISAFDKEEIRRFADRITPKSWNIILDQKDALETPCLCGMSIGSLDSTNGSKIRYFY